MTTASASPMSVGTLDLNPYFKPWIGSEYQDRGSWSSNGELACAPHPLVHALDESHYAGDYEIDESLTERVINDWAFTRDRGGTFFRRVIQTVEGCEYSAVNPEAGWARIAYSNYVQEALSGPRIAPSLTQWTDAERCFFGQLAITRPRVLLVLGRRLWDRLPFAPQNRLLPLSLPTPDNPVTDAWAYPFEANGVRSLTIAVWSYHPSSSKFDWREAHRRVVAANMHFPHLEASIFDELGWR